MFRRIGRNTEMPRRFPIAVAFVHKRNDTPTQLYRMRLAHGGSPSIAKEKHKSDQTVTTNPVNRDTL